MILMISSLGNTLDSPPNPRFGRTEIYIKYNTEDDTWVALDNPAVSQAGGAGVKASQFLVNHEATTAISGRFGPNAYQALNAAGIKMLTFDGNHVSIKQVVDAYKGNLLKEA